MFSPQTTWILRFWLRNKLRVTFASGPRPQYPPASSVLSRCPTIRASSQYLVLAGRSISLTSSVRVKRHGRAESRTGVSKPSICSQNKYFHPRLGPYSALMPQRENGVGCLRFQLDTQNAARWLTQITVAARKDVIRSANLLRFDGARH